MDNDPKAERRESRQAAKRRHVPDNRRSVRLLALLSVRPLDRGEKMVRRKEKP